jgi:hypothetical protein
MNISVGPLKMCSKFYYLGTKIKIAFMKKLIAYLIWGTLVTIEKTPWP